MGTNDTLLSSYGYIKQNQDRRSVDFVFLECLFVCVRERLPAGNILLFVIILLWWLWSGSGLVLLHYPHPSCLHCNIGGMCESFKPSCDGNWSKKKTTQHFPQQVESQLGPQRSQIYM